jgi:DNA-binding CsgD family transcriptional regulator
VEIQSNGLTMTSRHAQASSDVALVRLTAALCAANSLGELERAFAGFGPMMSVPMYGFYALDPGSERIEHNVGVNVSDAFVACYEDAIEFDPLIETSRTKARAVYNLELMSSEEWRESVIYRRAYSIHSMHHVVEAPILGDGEMVGALHFAASEATRDMAGTDLRLAEAVANTLGISIARIRRNEHDQMELARALAALEITNTAVAWSAASAAEPPRLNAAAQRLLGEIVEGFRHLYDLRARPPSDRAFSRRAEVELHGGRRAIVYARSAPARGDAGLVTVLELQPEHASIRREALAGLTPREAEVAGLVVEGLADREIAQRLVLSHHTVSQHVRAIYRKLGVDSRVALTRLLIAPPGSARRD